MAYTPPGGHTIVTVFGDGTTVYQVHAIHRRVVSDITGTVYHNDIVAFDRERLDNGVVRGTITGQFIWTFLPGDVGPGGVVFDHVMSLDIVGWATFVQDPDTWATLAFSLHGKYADICAAISGQPAQDRGEHDRPKLEHRDEARGAVRRDARQLKLERARRFNS